jgi:hypothetical protein
MSINRAKHSRKPAMANLRAFATPSGPQKTIFLKQYEETLSLYDARKASKITRDQLKELLANDPAFGLEMQNIAKDNIDRLEGAAFRQAINKGDKDMLKLLLQAKRREEYGPTAAVAVTVDVTAMSTEDLRAFVAQHTKK